MPALTSRIHGAELHSLLDCGSPPAVIDVRTPAEFETAHIPGAHNVPLDVLRAHCDDVAAHLPESTVLVCRSGHRAAQAAETLHGTGPGDVHVLDGGMVAWEAAGLSVDRGVPRWELERQVRLVAGSAVLAAILGSVAAPRLKWLAAGIGGGLSFAAVSNTCAMGTLLSRLPYNRLGVHDVATTVERLAAAAAACHVDGK